MRPIDGDDVVACLFYAADKVLEDYDFSDDGKAGMISAFQAIAMEIKKGRFDLIGKGDTDVVH